MNTKLFPTYSSRQHSPLRQPLVQRPSRMQKKRRGCLGQMIHALLIVALTLVVVVVGIPLAINGYICATTRGSFTTVQSAEAQVAQSLQPKDAIVVLVAGINWDGTPSAVLQDRLDVAVELYNAGVAPAIIMSGDNADASYNEVMAMAKYAEAQGVPARDVFCDHAGLSTYDSAYRLRYVFGVKTCIMVTQEYHLYRALYDAQSFDIDAQGVPSDRANYANKEHYELREMFARVKDFIAVLTKTEPVTKSEPVSLSESGTVTQWW